MEWPALLIFAGALGVAAGSPGPSIAALVARVLARGHREVLPFLAAMWFGEAVWLTLAVWGLASLAESFHLVFSVLKWVGVLYLMYLAWRMWAAPSRPESAEIPDRLSAVKMFAAGVQLRNQGATHQDLGTSVMQTFEVRTNQLVRFPYEFLVAPSVGFFDIVEPQIHVGHQLTNGSPHGVPRRFDTAMKSASLCLTQDVFHGAPQIELLGCSQQFIA